MQLPIIKQLVNDYSIEELKSAEALILDEQPSSIPDSGNDEGEQLTHILAAIEIKLDMQDNNTDLNTALRKYTQRVRQSIN